MSVSGLEIVRAIQSQKFISEPPPWVEHMSVNEENIIQMVENGRITSVWTPGIQFSVPDGYVQGGLCSAIADGSQALALLTTQPQLEVWVTQDLHTYFLRPLRIGLAVNIESIVLNKSATSALVETTFSTSEDKLAIKVIGTWKSAEGRRQPVVLK